MIGLENRQSIAWDIDTAHRTGARLYKACAVAGIEYAHCNAGKRQTANGLVCGDLRPAATRPVPAHALNADERARVLQVANEARFADVPPARIVPILAGEGVYIASELTFSRVLRDAGQAAHRGRAKTPRKTRPPTTHVATGAHQVCCWDMTLRTGTTPSINKKQKRKRKKKKRGSKNQPLEDAVASAVRGHALMCATAWCSPLPTSTPMKMSTVS